MGTVGTEPSQGDGRRGSLRQVHRGEEGRRNRPGEHPQAGSWAAHRIAAAVDMEAETKVD